MSKREKILALLLLFCTVITETHSVIFVLYPETEKVEKDYFLSPYFKYFISVLWYLKMIIDNFLMLIVFFVMSRLKNGFSKRFYYVCLINFGYHVFDFGSFVWNFKRSYEVYWAMLAILTVWELMLIFGKKPKLKAV